MFLKFEDFILESKSIFKMTDETKYILLTLDEKYHKLIEKFKGGVDVKVISFDDHTNAKFGVNIESIPHKMISGTRGGTMHNKFCVIDNQKVITGSYNWSVNAENKNDENAAVMYDDERASDYSVEFRNLFGMV